jgi:hypothetical protein
VSRTDALIERMESAGFAGPFVRACLPEWWDEQAERSESAWLQLQLGLADRFSLDPISLLDESRPLQLSDVGRAKFKHLALTDTQQAAANGFANGLARILLAAMPEAPAVLPSSATDIRRMLLSAPGSSWIALGELLQLCYAYSVPVAHLTKFPSGVKGMAAMTTSIGERAVIFTARRPLHPAQAAFFVAHELGHIAHGHVRGGRTIVEGLSLDPDSSTDDEPADEEEAQADAFAFELLTGDAGFSVSGTTARGTASELARRAIQAGTASQVDPGLIVLCFGRATGRWPQATAALKRLPDYSQDVEGVVNRALRSQLDHEMLSFEDVAYLEAVIGQ